MWHRYEVSKCCWKSGADRLAQHGVVTNPQLVKQTNKNTTVSSSVVRELVTFGKNVNEFMPEGIEIENYL